MNFSNLSLTKYFKVSAIAMLAISLVACQSEPSAQTVDASKYQEIAKPLTVSTGDKIEVMELFWYGCGHCFALEPHVDQWKKSMPEEATFVKVPAMFRKRWEFHGKAYYTMEALGVLDRTNEAFFHQIHILKKPINTIEQLANFLANFGLTEEQVTQAFNSFAVDSKVRNATRITKMSTATGVPAIIVDGKYLTSETQAGRGPELFKIVNQLVAKAASER
ncbi:MAG: thiol:disulfide interchange protein DsbA/DsbL [Gammaproteobacteria bacterium]|nr:thiol:disulfide interchange protein DsbA/DsbL [Gammaproteobacteria bacterium]